MADRSNSRAILIGDNSPFPRLEYVGRQPDIQNGDRIVSSGDGGVLPRGLPVGEAVATRDGGWRVRLYSAQAPVDFVWVWPYQRAFAPEEETPIASGIADPALSLPAGEDSVTADAAAPPGSAPAESDTPVDENGSNPGEDAPVEDLP